jgi:hypothetical protein
LIEHDHAAVAQDSAENKRISVQNELPKQCSSTAGDRILMLSRGFAAIGCLYAVIKKWQ